MKTKKTNKSIFMGMALLMGVLLFDSCDWWDDFWDITPDFPPHFVIVKFANGVDYSAYVPFNLGVHGAFPCYDCLWDSLQSAPIGRRTYPLEGGYYLTYNFTNGYSVASGYYNVTWDEVRKGILELVKEYEYPNTSSVSIWYEDDYKLVTNPFEEVYICEDGDSLVRASVHLAYNRSSYPEDWSVPNPIWGNLFVSPESVSAENSQYYCDYYRTPDPEMIEKLNDIIRKGELEKTFKRYK